MFVAETDAVPDDGLEPWANGGALQPNGPLAMHPAATVLNYGQVKRSKKKPRLSLSFVPSSS